MKVNNVMGKENEIESEFNRLSEKYQNNPNEFMKDFDKTINQLIIWFIANFNTTGLIRNEILNCANIMISIREPISKNNSYKSSCDNQK